MLVPVPGKSVEYVFEDFDDGDNLNNLAKTYPNYGWYFNAVGKANFTVPDSAGGFTSALKEDKDYGKYLALKFAIDSGFVLLGTHLGLDNTPCSRCGLESFYAQHSALAEVLAW